VGAPERYLEEDPMFDIIINYGSVFNCLFICNIEESIYLSHRVINIHDSSCIYIKYNEYSCIYSERRAHSLIPQSQHGHVVFLTAWGGAVIAMPQDI